VKACLFAADVCIFPSFAEAMPVSWLEAMAMEKAIVTSNIGWANELVTNEVDGMMENPKDHRAFALKILQLLGNEDLRIQVGKQARIKILKEFSSDVIVKKNMKFYSDLCN
jgi:glycosyltransferase involved in cell wall biosynthesis